MSQVAVDASMRLAPDSALPLFRVAALQKDPRLIHAITRRRFPGAGGEFDLRRGDAGRQRAAFARQLGIEPERTVWLDADESGPVRYVSEADAGLGATDWNSRVRGASGLVTEAFNLFLCTLYNDNAVVLLFDSKWYGVGLVNIRRAEISAEALCEAAELMTERWDAQPAEMTALIGPSIGPCCHTFRDPAPAEARGESNLWDLARSGLMKAGLRRGMILNPRACTACMDTEFFSREADGADGGAGAMAIGVRDDGGLRRQMNLRRAVAKGHRPAARETRESSLLEEEKRLNALVRCPYGQKKVYVRSVFSGQSAQTSRPEIALRCAVMREMGQAVGGYNVVTRDHIVTVCCGDFTLCRAYEELSKRQKR